MIQNSAILKGGVYLLLSLIVGFTLNAQRLLAQTSQTAVGEGVITLTTTRSIGEVILLGIKAKGDVTIDGIQETPKIGGFASVSYMLTKQTVTIRGDVTLLRCNSVELSSITLTNCDELTELYCLGNALTSLDLTHCPKLKNLWCNNNKLTALDLSKAPTLEVVWCYNNAITDLNLSHSSSLSILLCYWNDLETLDLNNCVKLQKLECYRNRLSTLDLSSCLDLENIQCNNNGLTTLTFPSENDNLKVVTCHDNKLQKLSIGRAPALEGIYCYNNQIAEITFHDSPHLMAVILHNNQVKGEKMTQLARSLPDRTNEYFDGSFVVHETPEARTRDGNICLKSDIAIAQPKNWKVYYYGEGYDYTPYEGEDDPSPAPTITMTTAAREGDHIMLSVSGQGEIEIEGAELKFGGLAVVKSPQITIRGHVTSLDCSEAQLTELNLSQMTSLTKLWCNKNRLTTLDTHSLIDLQILYCAENQLSELDVTANKKLVELDCSQNKLTQMNLAACDRLAHFLAYHNEIAQIDLSLNHQLIGLDLSENQLSALSVAHNSKLETIYCNGNAIKGAAMELFVSLLPDRSDRENPCNLFVIDTKNPEEANAIFKEQVQIARRKHWKVLDYTAGENDGAGSPYEGRENPISHAESVVLKTVKEDLSLTIGASSGEVYINWGDGEWVQTTVTERGSVVRGTCKGERIIISGTDISRLQCANNDITELLLNEVPELRVLHCYSNALSRIDLSAAPKITELYLQDNNLQQVDLTALGLLNDLNASNNQLTAISLVGNRELTSLSLLGNKLSSIDLSPCPKLEDVSLGYNQLSALDVRSNPKLYWIIIYKNRLSQDAMRTLFESLATRPDKDGTIKIFESRDDEIPEGNGLNEADISIATQKGWKVMDGKSEIPSSVSSISREDDAVQIYKSDAGVTVLASLPCLIYSLEGGCLGQTKAPRDLLRKDQYPPVVLLVTPTGDACKLFL